MWRDSILYQPVPTVKNLSCGQCGTGLQKYVEFNEFSNVPIQFFVDRYDGIGSAAGIVQVHYWTDAPESSAPPTSRVWLADIPPGGGSFMFQPTVGKKYVSLYKRNPSNGNFFDAACFRYIPQSRTFLLQTF
jgi:hypothetical protein